MLIGTDFDKIEFQMFGLNLAEPNAFIGDMILTAFSFYCLLKMKKITSKSAYFLFWRWFFISFAACVFLGGCGHLFLNYFGKPIKYASWYSGILSIFFIELAFISVFPFQKWKARIYTFCFSKLIAVLSVLSYTLYTNDFIQNQVSSFFIPLVYFVTGLGLTFTLLAGYYKRKVDNSFKFFLICFFLLLISIIILTLKINLFKWLDKNDISHILILTSLFIYLKSILIYSDSINFKMNLYFSNSAK